MSRLFKNTKFLQYSVFFAFGNEFGLLDEESPLATVKHKISFNVSGLKNIRDYSG